MEGIDYVFNPIYAPYFNISYRKRRKIELTTHEFQALVSGSLDEFRVLMRAFFSRWHIEMTEETLPLFPEE